MKQKLILVFLLLSLLIPAGFLGLMASETGSRWLIQNVFAKLPGKSSAEKIEGTLLGHLSLSGFNYNSATETVTLRKLEFTWQPSKLLFNTLKILDFTVDGLAIELKKTGDQPEKNTNDFNENIKLPVKLDISNFLITDASFQNGDTIQHLEKLKFVLKSEGEQIELQSLTLVSDLLNADAKGHISMIKAMPISLEFNWQVNTDDNGIWQCHTLISGDLGNLALDNRMQSPFASTLTGNVTDVLNHPELNIHVDWQGLNWPFVQLSHQIQSPHGHLTLIGPLNDYKLEFNAKLNQQFLPQADLRVDANGSLDNITLNKLLLKSETGQFELTGSASWQGVTEFALNTKGKNFNPALLVPELPGNLTFNSQLKGKLDPKALQITADIIEMGGQLRKQPFAAKGKLNLNGEKLAVDNLKLNSGKNKLSADGTLDKQQGDIHLAIDMPNLTGLWPELAGKLSGSVQIHGGWGNPAIKSNLVGKRLSFQQHSTDKLSLLADYSPDEQKKSNLNLTVEHITSSGMKMDNLSLNGSGTPKRHEFNAAITSPQASLTVALTGSLSNKQWRGELAKLDIKQRGRKAVGFKQNHDYPNQKKTERHRHLNHRNLYRSAIGFPVRKRPIPG